MPSPSYHNPDNMSKEQLLRWAEMNYAHWSDRQTNPQNLEPMGSNYSWFILLLWGERDD